MLKINSCFIAKWRLVWQFGLYGWNRAAVFISCAIWCCSLCYIRYRLFRSSPTKLKLMQTVDGGRIIRNVDCHLPIDTAQYTRSFESLSSQIWKPQIPHNARCVFFKVGTESLNIIQIKFLLQRIKQFHERVQKCFEGLRMRPFGKKSAAWQWEYTVERYRWCVIGFSWRNIGFMHVRVFVPRIVYYCNLHCTNITLGENAQSTNWKGGCIGQRFGLEAL